MRSLITILLASLLTTSTTSFSFNTYDLGLQGLYPRQHFHSANYEPPALQLDRWDSRCDDGYTFFTPRGPFVTGNARGPVIFDNKGELVWMDNKKWSQAMNFQVQEYQGEKYLTFWTKTKKGKGKGKEKKSKKSFVMLNSSYEVAHRITPVGKHLKGDSHEFRITPQGTALIALYPKRQADCTELHLGKSCWIRDGWFQEIDIQTGKLLFEWKASDHIGMKDVFSKPCRKDGYGSSKEDAFDWFHINAVDKTEEGDFVVSARYMHAIICISGKTGELLWQLGGKKNDFTSEDGALDFKWQHHVTWLGNNTIALFDNHANSVLHGPSVHSKGMIIRLDLESKTANLLGKYVHPDEILNVSQGSVQLLPNSSNVLVGFGNSPTWVEYSKEGEVLCSTHFAPKADFETIDFGLVKSYRVFKSKWVGKPKSVPNVQIKGRRVWASWNGATEVKYWGLQVAREKDGEFVTVQELEKDGFETSFVLIGKKPERWTRVVALDAGKKVMAHSEAVRRPSARSALLWLLLLPVILLVLSAVLIRRIPGQVLHFPSRVCGPAQVRLNDGGAARRRTRFGTWQLPKSFRRSHRILVEDEGMPLIEERFEDE